MIHVDLLKARVVESSEAHSIEVDCEFARV